MIPLRFAITIIWGNGHHYFIAYSETEAEAEQIAQYHRDRLSKRGIKRGAKARVLVWRQV